MQEIKGFNEAYKNCLAIEKVKQLNRQARQRKINNLVNKLVAEGMAKKEAYNIASAMWQAGLLN